MFHRCDKKPEDVTIVQDYGKALLVIMDKCCVDIKICPFCGERLIDE